ncbi:MAG: DNA polymerase III subunit beta [Candidatus Aminicenantes bacterium]|nr:DNA polymerase III subunit beta [Candidatus Aminicenantes bacterium]
MRFSIKKENIFTELQLLQGIVEKRNTMPILANILIDAKKNSVEMIGTDLEVGLRSRIKTQVDEEGTGTISGKKVYEIIRSLPEEKEVMFSMDNEKMMEISSGASQFKVLCSPKDDYPQVPEARFEKDILIPLDQFQEMINRVYFAITQEQRYYLNGALMILKGNQIDLISTDGHRLAYTSSKLDNVEIDEEINRIVSKKTLGELRKFEDEQIKFDLDESNLFFNVKNRTLISRIIEGKFPNYNAVIPKDNQNTIVFPTENITDAIRRVSLLSTERSKGIKMKVEKDKVELFSSNPELGEARDQVETEYKGDKFEIGFNSQYILDFLTTLESKNVRFEMKDPNSAVLMMPEEADEIEYKYVLMPMKI